MFIIMCTNVAEYDNNGWSKYITENDPEKIVELLQKEEGLRRKCADEYHEFITKWLEKNPVPACDTNIKKIKKWPAGIAQKNITQEMREEREAVKKHNEDEYKKLEKIRNVWEEKKREAEIVWAGEDSLKKSVINDGVFARYSEYEYTFISIPHIKLIDDKYEVTK